MSTKRKLSLVLAGATLMLLSRAGFADAPPLQALARMPVKEITVFKDGHAFVLHSGRMPTDAAGNVVLDYLPAPVIGTFWPYTAEKGAKLSSVMASSRKVVVQRTALSLRDLIEANVGAQVFVTEMPVGAAGKEVGTAPYAATILELPTQSGEELQAASPPFTGEMLAQKGSVVLLKTENGVKVLNLDRILDITFKGDYRKTLAREEFRNLLTLKLEWAGAKPPKEAEVGMVYLQRGIRWIPEYRVTIDGKGTAAVKLQATLVNELADLEDVTAHLVIGVPTFAFKDTVDPISLQQAVAQLSQYFRPDAQTAYAFSNAIMTQQADYEPRRRGAAGEGAGRTMDLGPEVANSGKSEDLFVFSIQHVTLRKGQRLVLPVSEFTLKYRDVYTLDIPFTPPPEMERNSNRDRQAELAKLFTGPKVLHKIRLANDSSTPLTTAPALIISGDRLVAQGLMTYTAAGADSDLDLTTAVDVRVKKSDVETKRTPNAMLWQGDQYGRIDLGGTITLTAFTKQPVAVEVTRQVLGNMGEADHDGKAEMVNVFEDAGGPEGVYPYWWNWYSWPNWWLHFNGIGRVSWTANLDPGKPLELKYNWFYFWR